MCRKLRGLSNKGLHLLPKEKKKQANVSKKVAASQSQPPQMKGESTQNKKVVDINVLSDDEFSALPEETLRRMRGDFD